MNKLKNKNQFYFIKEFTTNYLFLNLFILYIFICLSKKILLLNKKIFNKIC